MKTGRIIVLSGPSGSGESTLTRRLLHELPAVRLVTATTRSPRTGERDGIDYFFFTKERFLTELKQGNILEYTHIKNRDTFYGTYRPELEKHLEKGSLVIANTDLVGTRFFKETYQAITIFIHPGNLDNLCKRLLRRNPEMSSQERAQRLESAMKELEEEQPYYDYVINNPDGKLDQAVEEALLLIRTLIKPETSSKE